MATGKVLIHSNILPIIKKWLYSEKDIFIRELVSNSCDAIQKVMVLLERGQCQDSETRIDITIDKTKKTLTVSDTGIGMDTEEVEKYLAQIAFSGAEEFIKAYELNDPFIGHFGLGFYSAFMVADKVSVHTRSYKGSESVLWESDGSAEYEITEGTRKERGTEITLFLNKDSEEYLEESKMRRELERYCAFLPYPIFLNGHQINGKEFLVLKTPSECTKEDYLAFFRFLYPHEEDPLFWIHLNVEYPFRVKGILYFPRMRKDFDPAKTNVKLFCNRVFVSGDCKDVLPEYLTMLKGAIDSPDIPLNVSRSYLQVDTTVRQLGAHISKKVQDALLTLYKQDKDRFFSCWQDCEIVVKLAILHDEKFYDKAKEFLVWKDTSGTFTTLTEYRERNTQTNDTIFYIQDETHQLLNVYKDKGIEVLLSSSPLDAPVMAFIEKKESIRFKRIDASLESFMCDPTKEKSLLDSDGKTEAVKIADYFRSVLVENDVSVEAKSLASEGITGFISLSEEERRLRDYLARIAPEEKSRGIGKKTFIVNTNSPVVTAIFSLQKTNPEVAHTLAHHLYDLALLSQKEMEPHNMTQFIARSKTLLETVATTLG